MHHNIHGSIPVHTLSTFSLSGSKALAHNVHKVPRSTHQCPSRLPALAFDQGIKREFDLRVVGLSINVTCDGGGMTVELPSSDCPRPSPSQPLSRLRLRPRPRPPPYLHLHLHPHARRARSQSPHPASLASAVAGTAAIGGRQRSRGRHAQRVNGSRFPEMDVGVEHLVDLVSTRRLTRTRRQLETRPCAVSTRIA